MRIALGVPLLAIACSVAGAKADIVCPDNSYCIVRFDGSRDRVTIAPDGHGDTFAASGITIEVYLRNCANLPMLGVPRQEVMLYNSGLCICSGGNYSDGMTDADGMTTFSGTIAGGGCVENLQVYAGGVLIGSIPVKTNSPDNIPASPCAVDASDISALATRMGNPALYSPCVDYNESGTIDASDLAFWATFVGAGCSSP